MSSKRSPAARILEFFTTQPIGEADLVLGLVKEAVRKRKLSEAPGIQVARRTRTRKAKVNARQTPLDATTLPSSVA